MWTVELLRLGLRDHFYTQTAWLYQSVDWFQPPVWSKIPFGWTAKAFGRDLYGAKRMNNNYFGELLTSPPRLSWGSHLWFRVKCLNNYWIISMKFGTDIRVPLWMNCNNFGDPMTFHFLTSSGNFHLSNTLFMNRYLQNSTICLSSSLCFVWLTKLWHSCKISAF